MSWTAPWLTKSGSWAYSTLNTSGALPAFTALEILAYPPAVPEGISS